MEEAVDAGHPRAHEVHEAEGVAVGLVGVFDLQAGDGGVGGVKEDAVEAGVDGVAQLGAAGFEFGGELGELFPGVEGGAVDVELGGDGGGGLAGGQEG